MASNYYPSPLAEYCEIVADEDLFQYTLRELHSTMGKKLKTPVIGGHPLNLHQLFVEVTSRGGIEKITAEKRWKEVTATFNFPPTATNASYTLRNHYASLLQRYEEIYYLRAREWTPGSSVSDVGTTVLGVVDRKTEEGYLVTVTIGTEKLKGVLHHLPSLFNCSDLRIIE